MDYKKLTDGLRKLHIKKERPARKKGALTIEASLILPLYFFIMATAIRTGMDLYTECRQNTIREAYEELWVVDDFYRLQSVEKVIGEKSEVKGETDE